MWIRYPAAKYDYLADDHFAVKSLHEMGIVSNHKGVESLERKNEEIDHPSQTYMWSQKTGGHPQKKAKLNTEQLHVM